MELEVRKRPIFMSYIIHCHDPMGFVVGEVKDVLLLQMSRDRDRESRFYFLWVVLPNVSIVMRKEGGEGHKHDEIFSKLPFLDI